MPVFHQDVLEDLFTTNLLKQTTKLHRRSDIYCYQSTQVSRADVPECTVVIQPDFPLSPLQCSAPAVSVSSNCDSVLMSPVIHQAGRLCSEAQTVTITATQARPTTNVTDCTEAHRGLHAISSTSSDVSLPSAVYDRVRELFCTSDSELHKNRLSDTLLNSTASDGWQQNRHDGELVFEAGDIICTTAMSCSSDPSPLNSSYVDAGRMAYLETDVRSLSTASVVSAAGVPVMTTSVENVVNNIGELRITRVCSLQNDVAVNTVTSFEVTQSIQSHKSSQLGGQSSDTNKKLRSPEENSLKLNPFPGSKWKRSSLPKKTEHESHVLFKHKNQTKHGSKKRRLYNHTMLVEDNAVEEQSQNVDANLHVDTCNDNVDGHARRDKKSEKQVRNDILPSYETVPSNDDIPSVLMVAAVSLPTSQTSSNPVITVSDMTEPCSNLMEVTGVESDTKQLPDAVNNKTDLNAQQVTLCNESFPAVAVDECSHISLEQQTHEVQHDPAVMAGTDRMTDTECDVAAVVSSSVVPNYGLCVVSASVADISVPSPNVVECRRSLNNPCNSQILTGDGRLTNYVNGEMLDSIEHMAGIAAVENAQAEVTCINPPLCETDRSKSDSAVKKHTLNIEKSSDMLSSVVAESDRCPLVRHDDNLQANDDFPQHSINDALASSTQGNNQKTSDEPVNVSSVSNTHDSQTHPADNNTNVAKHSLDRIKPLKDTDCRSCSGASDLNFVFSASAPCNTVNEFGTFDWYSQQNTKRNMLQKKLRRRTTMTSLARTSSTDHNKNTVPINCDKNDHHELMSGVHCEEKTSSSAGLCITSETTNEGSSPSLQCGQKQSDGSYCLPDITVSMCRLSAVGTPFPPSHSCSLHCREQCRIAEESLGYCQPSTKADDGRSGGSSDHLMQSERHSTSDLIASSNVSSTYSIEKFSGVVAPISVSSDVVVCTSADAAVVSATATESKQSSTSSGGISKLTLPTPKNSLTSYQPANRSSPAVAASDSSLATATSQVQPNYGLIQVSLFIIFKLF